MSKLIKEIKKHRKDTPFFIYDLKIFDNQVKKIKDAFRNYPDSKLLYAIKANFSPFIIKRAKRLDLGISVSSPEELEIAIKYNIRPISYTAPFIDKKVLQFAKRNKNIEINLNNKSEINKFKSDNLGIRINPLIGYSYLPEFYAASQDSQFGINYKEIENLNIEKIIRLHMHSSSDSYRINLFIKGLKRLLKIAEKNPQIKILNLGGGIGTPILKKDSEFNFKKYANEIIKNISAFSKKYNRKLTIQLEPGSYLIRPSGFYVTKVVERDTKNNIIFYFVDGSKNNLRGIAKIEKILYISKTRSKNKGYLVGKTCQKSDRLIKNEIMPDLKIDDLVIIPMAGAYCRVKADNFHMAKKPKEFYFN